MLLLIALKILQLLQEIRTYIKDCPILPRKNFETAHVSAGSSNAPNFVQSFISPEMIQQIIATTFSTLRISGNKNYAHKPLYFNSVASDHMTNTTLPLHNVQKYKEDLHIQTADGNSLLLHILTSLDTIFLSQSYVLILYLLTNQLIKKFTVQFSIFGCFVQE